ncbi:HNH endonuclease [Rhizobium sp.]|jgi:5-methylcytosine-specific restriction enzyme A|uniref:HNH endonuclease n=1 Tax=Rhizobium sp. TaxID=391 RepID=UPI000E884F54|nr:HNH endonuclease [Rhizobium sp.]
MADWPYNTTAWKKLRLAKLTHEPLCQPCGVRGQLTPANTVDHNVAIKAGGAPFPPLEELTSMCARCHNEKTSTFDRGTPKPFARQVKGFDAFGNPVDTNDGWYGGGSNHQKSRGSGPLGGTKHT